MSASENITRAEAAERSSLISVESYDVVLDVTSNMIIAHCPWM